MSLSFSFAGSAAQIVFGNGTRKRLGQWIEKIGCARALVLSTPQQAADAESVAAQLGPLAAGVFAGAVMHTPVDVTETAVAKAKEVGADCLVSLGGGSTTGLGKAIAYRTNLRQIAVPTTYAGSEVTPILGQTAGGEKTTLRDRRIMPAVVIYDPELTTGLPVGLSVTSGLNAMAHAAEGLYAADRNPVATLMAGEGLAALHEALPAVVAAPKNLEARGRALYGAWLCGTVLGSVGMSLHHKLCHVLGGTFDLPHAETHAIMLPHTIGFNADAAANELAPLTAIVGAAGPGLYDFAKALGAPTALRDIGMKEADLDRAAEIATKSPYANPRPIDKTGIRNLLRAAWAGERPAI